MNLADYLRPLLRDHDCVIIPDFGGLVAAYVPARVQPGGRHQLSPPTRQVAFNQALTRNDGLLVDALCQHLNLPAPEAREALRQAVAALYRDLQDQQRTELPGIGVFRKLAGRGLQFEYTGANDLLPAVFGLPELTVLPISVIDARLAREQQALLVPRLRSAGRGLRLRRAVPGAAIGLLAGLAVASLYFFNLHPTILPAAWQSHVPRWEQGIRSATPQQAALAQSTFTLPTPEPLTPPRVANEAVVSSAAGGANPSVSTVLPTMEVASATALAKSFEHPADAPAAPATLVPSSVALAAAPAPAAPPQTVDPVDAMLAQHTTLPSPISPRARGRSRKLPAAAAIAVANASNVARPIPMAMRKAGTPTLVTTSYSAARNAAPLPVPASSVATPAATTPKLASPHALVPTKVLTHDAWPVATKTKLGMPGLGKAKALVPGAAKTTAAPAAASEATIKTRSGRYYLVVAAYSSLARAEQGRRNLAHAGHANAKIILPYPGTRHYRLSAADYADRPTAQAAATQLRKNPHVDKGLMVFPY
jgi:hypothetical protein